MESLRMGICAGCSWGVAECFMHEKPVRSPHQDYGPCVVAFLGSLLNGSTDCQFLPVVQSGKLLAPHCHILFDLFQCSQFRFDLLQRFLETGALCGKTIVRFGQLSARISGIIVCSCFVAEYSG